MNLATINNGFRSRRADSLAHTNSAFKTKSASPALCFYVSNVYVGGQGAQLAHNLLALWPPSGSFCFGDDDHGLC